MDKRSHGSPILVPSDGTSKSVPLKRAERGGDSSYYESELQQLVDRFPQCLPLDEIEPGISENFVSICMELPTEHGPIDNLLMTPAGDIALVETKLWRNPEARREVVAQALDYASCLFEMEYSDLEAAVMKGKFGDREKPAMNSPYFSRRLRVSFLSAARTRRATASRSSHACVLDCRTSQYS